jgi:dihydrolipoamide dehydrogenase
MEIPSPYAGKLRDIKIAAGDKVSEGAPILIMEIEETAATEAPTDPASVQDPSTQRIPTARRSQIHAEVVVLGAGPGGYTAAFRAADLGKKTLLIERYPDLGGVCLNVGCIPSKALLHVARVITEVDELRDHGLDFGDARIDQRKIRVWTENVIGRLTGGLKTMAKQRQVEIVHGTGRFTSGNEIVVQTPQDKVIVSFDSAIIAAGSQAAKIPGLADDPRIMDSTDALQLRTIPSRLLVIGGGIIGLEMAAVFDAFGSRITVVEMLDRIMADCDKDMVRPLQKRISKGYDNIYLNTRVTGVEPGADALHVQLEGKDAPASASFDAILVAVGRRPNGHVIDAIEAGVEVTDEGSVPVDDQQRTNVPHMFAIGDIAGGPMLAHKATHEGKIAAEVIAGLKSAFDQRVIPSVAYTDPEVAWVGTTEAEAKEKGINYGKGVFPWAASGRSLALNRDDGITKLLFERETHRVIGMAAVGPQAGDLIAEGALAIEMGCDARDIGLTIHPHPTLSETIGMAAEAFEGTITDLYIPKQ